MDRPMFCGYLTQSIKSNILYKSRFVGKYLLYGARKKFFPERLKITSEIWKWKSKLGLRIAEPKIGPDCTYVKYSIHDAQYLAIIYETWQKNIGKSGSRRLGPRFLGLEHTKWYIPMKGNEMLKTNMKKRKKWTQ